ncbi:MAG: DNA-binding protein [Gaiellales bacterium]|nr:DNA-binding protein [Gaiellales bacterium]
MNYSEGRIGRVFVLRLQDGEVLNDTLEAFAAHKGVLRGLAFFVGGSADGSKMVVGPDASRPDEIVPLLHALTGAREVLAVGTIFPNEAGRPVAHVHAAAGREGGATVGCTRAGLTTWLVGEVVVLELVGDESRRTIDPATGFELLQTGADEVTDSGARAATGT